MLNIILNLILVNAYGIVGGSLATLITSIIIFIIGVFAILRIKPYYKDKLYEKLKIEKIK